MVQITLQIETSTRGKGYWKFNTSLLKDKEYIELVTSSITTTVENIKNGNHAMLWDIVKMNIRGETTKFCSHKKRKDRNMKTNYCKKLKSLKMKRMKTLKN